MIPKKEMIQARIPEGNDWGASELEAKAEELGLNKSELIIKAVDFFINLDIEVLKEIEANAAKLNISEHIFIQNMIIDVLARSAAEFEVYGVNKKRILPQFMFVDDKEGLRAITGKELFDELVRIYKFDIKHNKGGRL